MVVNDGCENNTRLYHISDATREGSGVCDFPSNILFKNSNFIFSRHKMPCLFIMYNHLFINFDTVNMFEYAVDCGDGRTIYEMRIVTECKIKNIRPRMPVQKR